MSDLRRHTEPDVIGLVEGGLSIREALQIWSEWFHGGGIAAQDRVELQDAEETKH